MAQLKNSTIDGNLSVSGTLSATSFNGKAQGIDGLTATVDELNYMDGVTSNVQTQLNTKVTSLGDMTKFPVTYGFSVARNGDTIGVANGADNYYMLVDSTNNFKTGIQLNGASEVTWAGYSKDGHTHALPALTDCTGTLSVAKGGTGATTFTSGAVLIGAGTGAVTTRAIQNNTSASAVTANNNIITGNTLAVWNGRYGTGTSSNLAYCNKGAFGDMATKTASNYSLSTHTHTLSTLGAKYTCILSNGSSASSVSWTSGTYDFIVGIGRPNATNTPVHFCVPVGFTGDFQLADDASYSVFTMSATGISYTKGNSGKFVCVYGCNIV